MKALSNYRITHLYILSSNILFYLCIVFYKNTVIINLGEKMAKNNSFYKMDMLILSALKIKDCYGYEMVKLIYDLSKGLVKIKEGTMYPILYSLLDNKYISSQDIVIERKVRVYYHLEPKGEIYLQEIIQDYQTMIDGINNVIYHKKGENYE